MSGDGQHGGYRGGGECHGAADGRPFVRRRVRDGLVAAVVPVTVCLAALVGLTAWTTAGAAGSPPRIEAGVGHLRLPRAADDRSTAVFRITNLGDAPDQLLSVSSPAAEEAVLTRHEPVEAGTGDRADAARPVTSVTVPAGRTLTMTPNSLDLVVKVRTPLRVGDTVPFVLHFRRGGPVGAVAFVVPFDN
ncbi:copper chaperone PCu(A)C [Streptomyces sp. NPDC058623]|uniref:copper chaperone PCu(A)C n=1 Tax=Streptomyces sp. NPDC058623 TaxID=3346563 RepID=UPI003666BF95